MEWTPERGDIGGDFDDFLRDEHLLEEVEATATKRVIAFQAREMERRHLTKQEAQ